MATIRWRRGSSGELIVTAGDVFPAVLAAAAAALAGTAVYDMTAGSRGTDRLAALLAGMVLLGIGAAALSERSRFVFDPQARTIAWQRRWLVNRRGGVLRFGDVTHVVLQISIGSQRVLHRRIVLRQQDGTDLPLTVAYGPDSGGEMRTVAEHVRTTLGLAEVTDDAAHRA